MKRQSMVSRFIVLQWKAFIRSSSFGKSLGLKIFLAFMALYFAAIFLLLGIGLYPLLGKMYPSQEPISVVNRMMLAWFSLELFVRFMVQTLPVMTIKPLLLAPLKKRKVVNYLLMKSLFSFFNFLPLLVIIPFGVITWYRSDIGLVPVMGWMMATYSLSLAVNFSNFLLKKKFADDLKALLPYVIAALILVLLEYFGIFRISEYFGAGMNAVLDYPILIGIPLLITLALFKWNQQTLEKRFYLDDTIKGKTQQANTRDFQWVRKFGDIAPFLQLDLKLIWRNKRPKATIFLSLLILGYGLIFYPQDSYQDTPAIFVFVGIFMTGIFMINFGQFVPAWDSPYYSMMMSQNIPLKKYLASKAALISLSIIILAVLTTPYMYFGWNILWINLACAVYNLGVNVPILLYAGSFNRKRIDLEKSPFMNYQGTGAAQWVVGLPLMIIPILVFWLLHTFFGFEAALGVLIGLGLVGLLIRKPIMDVIELAYRKNKYAMINGFQQSGE